ncbi:Protein of unknown function [Pyronema omphalodes CBS 100304]|uniref:Uncharacterized protein n=1 Tax=Pyronema omphalodes (strain CBS 100304) TaxID=1076935 RepID=U4KVM0_PYROM|nr:Protein of unknown function [Pyronema omphalodes CBS 100304]
MTNRLVTKESQRWITSAPLASSANKCPQSYTVYVLTVLESIAHEPNSVPKPSHPRLTNSPHVMTHHAFVIVMSNGTQHPTNLIKPFLHFYLNHPNSKH